MNTFRKVGYVSAVVTIALAFPPCMQMLKSSSEQTPWRNLSLGQLTAIWWEWAFSIPISSSPFVDPTGANAYNGQPYANSGLLFLAGTFTVNQEQNGDVTATVTRSISVKQGTALFFPLINSEFDNTCGTPHVGGNCLGYQKFPNVVGVPQMAANAAAAVNSVTSLSSTLVPTDSTFNTAIGPIQNLNTPRLQSPPFSFTLPNTDNVYQSFGVNVSGTVAPAVSDGYYSFVPGSLSVGYYVLHFGGTEVINSMGNTFTEAITYKITVTP